MFLDFIIKYTDIFIERLREANAKASYIFSTKNTVVFLILMFEILSKCLLTASLVLNKRALSNYKHMSKDEKEHNEGQQLDNFHFHHPSLLGLL